MVGSLYQAADTQQLPHPDVGWIGPARPLLTLVVPPSTTPVSSVAWAPIVIPAVSSGWPSPSFPLLFAGHDGARGCYGHYAHVVGSRLHCRPWGTIDGHRSGRFASATESFQGATGLQAGEEGPNGPNCYRHLASCLQVKGSGLITLQEGRRANL